MAVASEVKVEHQIVSKGLKKKKKRVESELEMKNFDIHNLDCIMSSAGVLHIVRVTTTFDSVA